MTYFLDFDRVLFDTDAYQWSLLDLPTLASLAPRLRSVLEAKRDQTLTGGTERIDVWNEISSLIHSGALTFPPGALTQYVYADVSEFLRAVGNEAIILTFGERERQRIKIESGLAGIPRLTVMYIEVGTKAEYLAERSLYNGGPALFVDDRPVELEAMAALYPQMKLFEMRRDGAAGDGRWPVISSLSALP